MAEMSHNDAIKAADKLRDQFVRDYVPFEPEDIHDAFYALVKELELLPCEVNSDTIKIVLMRKIAAEHGWKPREPERKP